MLLPVSSWPGFKDDYNKVITYLEDTITWLTGEMNGLDALFGPSAITSLIHRLQLDLSGADISFTAPLSLSANLDQGAILVSDMFKLYRFENMLYRMNLSGEEIEGLSGICSRTLVQYHDRSRMTTCCDSGKMSPADWQIHITISRRQQELTIPSM